MGKAMANLAGLNNLANLLLRLLLGGILIRSGYSKFFEAGIPKIIDTFRDVYGIPVAVVTGPFIATLESVGGMLLLLGLFTRYVGVLYTIEFIVAAWVKFTIIPPPAGGYLSGRLDLMILFVAFFLATQGAGKFSLDAKLRHGAM